MSKQPVVTADPERMAVDAVTSVLEGRVPPERIGTDLPSQWTPRAQPFVQVLLDGTPTLDWPVRAVSVVRVTVWSGKPSEGKELALVCMGLLLALDTITPGTGLLLAKDDGGGRLASFTVLVSVWTNPIDAPDSGR